MQVTTSFSDEVLTLGKGHVGVARVLIAEGFPPLLLVGRKGWRGFSQSEVKEFAEAMLFALEVVKAFLRLDREGTLQPHPVRGSRRFRWLRGGHNDDAIEQQRKYSFGQNA